MLPNREARGLAEETVRGKQVSSEASLIHKVDDRSKHLAAKPEVPKLRPSTWPQHEGPCDMQTGFTCSEGSYSSANLAGSPAILVDAVPPDRQSQITDLQPLEINAAHLFFQLATCHIAQDPILLNFNRLGRKVRQRYRQLRVRCPVDTGRISL